MSQENTQETGKPLLIKNITTPWREYKLYSLMWVSHRAVIVVRLCTAETMLHLNPSLITNPIEWCLSLKRVMHHSYNTPNAYGGVAVRDRGAGSGKRDSVQHRLGGFPGFLQCTTAQQLLPCAKVLWCLISIILKKALSKCD